MGSPASKANVTVGATSTATLAANADRTHAIIKASSDNTEEIWLGIGAAAVVDTGISLDPGETFQIGPHNWTPLAINAISDSGSQVAEVFEA